MKRKRLTQVFPFLLPIRKWQRKKLFYLEMLIDGNKYAKNKSEALLPNTVFETSSLMTLKHILKLTQVCTDLDLAQKIRIKSLQLFL